ncbi:MAG: hypothetical protein WBG41_13580 [Acidimicrobiales bacterium]
MIRKVLLVAAVVAVPAGLIIGGGVASAKSPPINAKNDTATCTTVSGSAKFSPAITSSEKAGTTKTTVKATLTGCTSNAVGLRITNGKTTGSFTSTSHVAGTDGCTALAGTSTETGSLTTKWKTSPKLSSGNSVTPVTQTYGTIASDGNAQFEIPGPGGTPSGTGSFEGTNGGASDGSDAQTTTSASSILATCEGKKGLTGFNFTTPPAGQPAAASFG